MGDSQDNNVQRKALIFGVTGQDGSYLSELLLNKGYDVTGVVRRSSTINTGRVDHLLVEVQNYSPFRLVYGDVQDALSVHNIVCQCEPDEVYNLAAQSHVRISFDIPSYTVQVIVLGTLHILEAIRSINPEIRFYQASSSEMYGRVCETPQKETTPFHPRSPYACAKACAFWQTINHREAYGMFTCNGILFNHESPRRGKTFVTRKITRAAARIRCGLQDRLYLGNLDARRDWGFAGDYVKAMWRMLQHDEPGDYVVATGETHSVREFADRVFRYHGLNWEEYVDVDPRYIRPAEVDLLLGDASKARSQLGWVPEVRFGELVRLMAAHDLEEAERESSAHRG